MKTTGKLVKDFIKGQAGELSSAGKAITNGAKSSSKRMKDNLMTNGKVTPGGVANTLLLSDAPRGRTLENLYTGKRLNGKLIGGIGVAAGVSSFGGMDNMVGAKTIGSDNPADIKTDFDLNQLTAVKASAKGASQGINPYMSADGAGSGARPTKSNAQTLNASGDMVFGMHNTRR